MLYYNIILLFRYSGIIIEASASYRKGFGTAGGILCLSLLIPFLQYCFQPWRKLNSTRTSSFAVPPPVSLRDEMTVLPETIPFTFNNPAFEGSSLDISHSHLMDKRRSHTFQVSTKNKIEDLHDTKPFHDKIEIFKDDSSEMFRPYSMSGRKTRSYTVPSPISKSDRMEHLQRPLLSTPNAQRASVSKELRYLPWVEEENTQFN